MPPPGRIFRNISAQLVAQVAIKTLNIAVSLLLVRWLGPLELGHYAYISAFCYPFGMLGDVGLGLLAIREISRDPRREAEILAALTRLYLLLSLLSGGAALGLALVIGHDPRILLGIGLVAFSGLFASLASPYVVGLTAREDLHRLSAYQTASSALSALITLGVLLAGGGVIALLSGGVGTNVLLYFFVRWFARALPVGHRFSWALCRDLLHRAIPFGLLLVGFALYYRLDMVMLRWFHRPEEVGRYAAAYRFLDAMLILGATIGAPFYPRLSTLLGFDRKAANRLVDAAWRLALGLGMPVVVGATFIADPLTTALFGQRFADAGGLVRLLVWAGLPVLLIAIPSHAMNAADRVWNMAGIYWVSVGANFLANLFLIPRWGAEGAGVVTVLCAWLNLLLVLRGVRRHLELTLSCVGTWRYLLATSGMAVLLWVSQEAGLIARIFLGAIGYGCGLLLLGYLRSPDFAAVRQLLRE